LAIENGISSTKRVDAAICRFADGELQDLIFVDDGYLMVLWAESGEGIEMYIFLVLN
jgi:hypothetical protein